MYAEQVGWAVDEGVENFVISETNDYLGKALIALEVIADLGLPAMVTMAPTQPHGPGTGMNTRTRAASSLPRERRSSA